MGGVDLRLSHVLCVFSLIFLLAIFSQSGLADPVACCLVDLPGFEPGYCADEGANLLTLAEIDACNAGDTTFAQMDQICSPYLGSTAPLVAGCQVGCCCFTDNSGIVQSPDQGTVARMTRDSCTLTNQSAPNGYRYVFLSNTGWNPTQSCSTLCGVPGTNIGTNDNTCTGRGGYWCAPGTGAPGSSILTGISDAGTRGVYECRDMSCSTGGPGGDSCVAAGAAMSPPRTSRFLLNGEYCSGMTIGGIASCCETSSIQSYVCEGGATSNPQGRGGTLCPTTGGCSGTSLMSLLSDSVRQSLSSANQLCCDASGCGTTTCAATETYCADGIDNDCDGQLDGADSQCSGTIQVQAVSRLVGSTIENPASGLIVRATAALPGGGAETYSGYTDTLGRFTLLNVLPANYDFFVDNPRYTILSTDPLAPVAVPSGTPRSVRIVLQELGTVQISGRVTDATLSPPNNGISGARVFVSGTLYQATTDSSGNYVITGVPQGGDYAVYAYATGYGLSANRFFPDLNADAVANFQLSPLACSQTNTTLLASNVKGAFSVALSWNAVSCGASQVTIYRCAGSGTTCRILGSTTPLSPAFTEIATLSTTQNSFVDTTSVNDTTYTYVLGVLQYGQTNERLSTNVSIFTGNAICENRLSNTDEFCHIEYDGLLNRIADAGFRCDERNIARPADNAGTIVDCLQPYRTCDEFLQGASTQVACVDISQSCSNNQGSLGQPFHMLTSSSVCSALDRCYYDVGDSVVNSCLACQPSQSCRDYQSRTACEQNICGAGLSQNSCSWIPLVPELGVGSCVDTSDTQCEDCNGGLGVFGTCPSESVCENPSGPFASAADGRSCYFRASDASCNSCDTVSCFDLSNEAACVGADGTRAPFDIMTLAFNDPAAECGLSNCVWVENPNPAFSRCVRDDNNNAGNPTDGNDCGLEFNPHAYVPFGQDPAALGLTVEQCQQDKTPPRTSLSAPILYNPQQEAELVFSVYESDFSFPAGVDTFFCIEPAASGSCTPLSNFNRVPRSGVIRFTGMYVVGTSYGGDFNYELASGNNTIKYYSRDVFNNFELVQARSIIVDNLAPIISLNTVVVQGAVSGQHTIIATADLTDNDGNSEAGQCMININQTNGVCLGGCANYGAFNIQHLREFNGLYDGTYVVQATCRDVFNNTATVTRTQPIDFDLRASNAMPRGPITNPNVTLSVDTTGWTFCRYSTTLDDFNSISPFQTLLTRNMVAMPDIVRHEINLSLTPNAAYTYYLVCNFVPTDSIEVTSFVVDTILPNVQITQGDRLFNDTSISYVLSNPVLRLSCSDAPAGGFGCGEYKYCIANYGTSCTPVVTRNQPAEILLNNSASVCVQGQENFVNGQGGRYSPLSCYSFSVDLVPPRLVLDGQTFVTATRNLSLTGFVYDPEYVGTWMTGTAQQFIESSSRLSVSDFMLNGRLEATYVVGSNTPIIDIPFRYLDDATHYKLRVDTTTRNTANMPLVSLIRVTPGQSITIGTPGYLPSWNSSMPIRIIVQGTTMNASVGGFSMSVTDSLLLGGSPGRIGIRTTTPTQVTLRDVDVIDLTQIQNNEVGYRFADDVSFQYSPAEPSFNFTVSVESMVSGENKTLVLHGKDGVGQLSAPERRVLVIYDDVLPVIANLSIREFPGPGSPGFVEQGHDSVFTVNVSDRNTYGTETLRRVWVAFGRDDVNDTFLLYNTTLRQWSHIVNTSGIESVGSIPVTVFAEDLAGNIANRTFSGSSGLRIRDSTNPAIVLLADDPLLTAQSLPSVSVSTSEIATCIAHYIDGSGISRSDAFVARTGGRTHDLTFNYALACLQSGSAPTDNIFTSVSVQCVDSGSNVNELLFNVLCDQLPPVAGFMLDNNAYMHNYTEFTKSFYLRPSATTRAHYVADENVQCRFCQADATTCTPATGFAAMSQAFSMTLLDEFSSSDSTTSLLNIGPSGTLYYFACKDEVGNIGATKSILVNRAEQTAAPATPIIVKTMPDLSPTTATQIFADTLYPASSVVCEAEAVDESDGSTMLTLIGQDMGSFTRHQATAQLPNGPYVVTLRCSLTGSPPRIEERTVLLTVDNTLPALDFAGMGSTIAASSPLQTIIGTSTGASEIIVERMGVEVYHFTNDLPELTRPFSIPLPVFTGMTQYVIKAVSPTGAIRQNTITYTYDQAVRVIEPLGLLSYTNQHFGDVVPVYVGREGTSGHTIELIEVNLTQVGVIGTQTKQFNQDTYEFAVPSMQQSYANYLLVLRSSATPTQYLGAYTLRIKNNNHAPYLRLTAPRTTLIETGYLQGIVGYSNYPIVDGHLVIGGEQQSYELFLSRLFAPSIPPGGNDVDLVLTNDIGHSAQIKQQLVRDTRAPRLLNYSIQGSNSRTTQNARPSIVGEFDEYTQVLEASVVGHPGIGVAYDAVFGANKTLSLLDNLATPGVYTLSVRVQDGSFNQRTDTSIVFTYQIGNFTLTLADPAGGGSSTLPFPLRIISNRQATCRWIAGDSVGTPFENMEQFTNSDGSNHVMDQFPYNGYPAGTGPFTITVLCQDTIGTPVLQTRHVFTLVHDNTPPVVQSIVVEPSINNIVTERVSTVNITVLANEDVICRYRPTGATIYNDYPSQNYAARYSMPMGIAANTAYSLDVECKNRAQLTTMQPFSFIVDFTGPSQIIIEEPNTSMAVPRLTTNMTIRTSSPVDTQGCTYVVNEGIERPFSMINPTRYYASSIQLVQGLNSISITCRIAGAPVTITSPLFADIVPPSVTMVDDGDLLTTTDRIPVSVTMTDEAGGPGTGSGIRRLDFLVGTGLSGAARSNIRNGSTTAYGDLDGTFVIDGVSLQDNTLYYVSVRAVDNAGLMSSFVSSNGVRVGPIALTMLQPLGGVTAMQPFNIEIESSRAADCRWFRGNVLASTRPFSGMTPFDYATQRLFRIENFTISGGATSQVITVACIDSRPGAPATESVRTTFTLTQDTSAPVISSVQIVPSDDNNVVVQYVDQVNAVVTADEPIRCSGLLNPGGIVYANTTSAYQSTYSLPLDVYDGNAYTLEISCVNYAGLTASRNVSFSTNFNAAGSLQFRHPAGGYINETTINITLAANKPIDATGCFYRVDSGAWQNMLVLDAARRTAFISGVILTEGDHTLYARCAIEGIEQNIERQIIVDITPPRVTAVNDYATTESLSILRFAINATDDTANRTGSGIGVFEYSIGTSRTDAGLRANVANGTTSDTTPRVTGLDLDANETYYVTVRARDRAGRYSDWLSSDGVVAGRSSGGGGGGGYPLSCSNGVRDSLETSVDCGGPLCRDCLLGQACVENNDCQLGACVNRICSSVSACQDGNKNANETDVDCGGLQCNKCAVNKACTSNNDCSSGYCSGNVCKQPTCEDNIKNGLETDVDCGGICSNKCAVGDVCEDNADCESKVCTGSKCVAASCTDRIKNGLETDADCGGSKCGACSANKECLVNSDCSTGKCFNGYCRSATSDPSVVDNNDTIVNEDESGLDLWSILFLVIALLVVGGAVAYLAYTQFLRKKPRPLPPPPAMNETVAQNQHHVGIESAPRSKYGMVKDALQRKLYKQRYDSTKDGVEESVSALGGTSRNNKSEKPTVTTTVTWTPKERAKEQKKELGVVLAPTVEKNGKPNPIEKLRNRKDISVSSERTSIDKLKGVVEKKESIAKPALKKEIKNTKNPEKKETIKKLISANDRLKAKNVQRKK